MGFIEVGIEFQVMGKDFIFLVELDMAAHYDDGLPHKEHKNAADKGQYQYGNTAKGNNRYGFMFLGKKNELVNQPVVVGNNLFIAVDAKIMGHYIKHIACNLWGQYGKIVGDDDENNP